MRAIKWMAVLFLLLAAAGCRGVPITGNSVRVGSTNTPESRLMGEVYASLLEKNGVPVERKLNLGDSKQAQDALVNKQIDLYPETTQTAYLTLMEMKDGDTDPASIFDKVSKYYNRRYQIVWLDPANLGGGNQIAPVVRAEALNNYPKVKDALNGLTAALDEATLKELVRKVDSGSQDAAAVAQDFLRQKGLIQ